MNPGRTAHRIVADSHLSNGDEAFSENLMFFWTDVYHDHDEEPPVLITHTWGDSMVTLSFQVYDADGEPLHRSVLQLSADSLLEFAGSIVEVMQKRDRGDVNDA
jgi:hypothetical protein